MKTYSEYLKSFFPIFKVQKISVDAGFTCPNRDGTIGIHGCIYCRNDSFTPSYCKKTDSIADQISKGKKFFERKYPDMHYLVYFQSYTSTYAHNETERAVSYLKNIYSEALNQEKIVGLVIGSRPDTLPDYVLDILEDINKTKPVFLEIGAETSHDTTLCLINRLHKWEDVESSVRKASLKGLHCGLHLIVGLPGETEDMIFETVKKTVELPIDTIKFHHLQILHGTRLFDLWKAKMIDVEPFSLESYIALCRKIIKLVPDNIVIERFLAQSPPDLVAAPAWGIKNYQFMNMIYNQNNL